MGVSDVIRREVSGWPGVSVGLHRFGGFEFRVRGREIGHLHGEGFPVLADLPFPRKVREELVAAGKAREHHVLPQTGWVSYRVRGEEDVEGALELFRLNYGRILSRGERSGV